METGEPLTVIVLVIALLEVEMAETVPLPELAT
jgi:hypothetical protein